MSISIPIVNLVENYNTITTIGTAKNTGKTTTLNYLIDNLDCIIGITSTGRDGEDFDVIISDLPKPKIFIKRGMFVTTIEELIDKSKVNIIERTNILTPLGYIIIVTPIVDHNIQVIGPTINKEISFIKERFFDLGCIKVLIDGSFNRKAVLSICDGFILSTGSAYNEDPNIVKQHLFQFIEMTNLEKYEGIIYKKNHIFSKQELKIFDSTLIMESIIDNAFIDTHKLLIYKDLTIVIKDINSLFIDYKCFKQLLNCNIRFKVREVNKVLCITVNPFSYFKTFPNSYVDEIKEMIPDIPVYITKL